MRLVIVGFGHAGRQHAEAVEQIPHITVHSVLDSAETVNVAPFSRAASWSDVLADDAVDAMALCVPPGDRAELAVAALRAGKAVLLEKPPVMSVAELDRLAAVPGRVGVMLQHRFRLPAVVLGRPMTDAVGTLLVSRPRDAVKHYTGWRGDSERALGGITAHLGVHYLDLACQVLGDVERVEIHDYRECAPGIDVRVSGLVRFTGRSTLSFTIAADVPARAEQLVIAGDDRYLTVADGAVTLRAGDRTEVVPAAPTSTMRTRVYEEFADGPDVCSLGRSRSVLAVLDAVRRAGTR